MNPSQPLTLRTKLLILNGAMATGLALQWVRGMHWQSVAISAMLLFPIANLLLFLLNRNVKKSLET